MDTTTATSATTTTAAEGDETTHPKEGGEGQGGKGKFIPGASWNSKKARDEWQRAWAGLEDKWFSLSEGGLETDMIMIEEFGDPFDETLEENQGQSLGLGGV
ncbi:MAG: hypothetical protein Q9164_005114 [Protoblastenia rupestris]